MTSAIGAAEPPIVPWSSGVTFRGNDVLPRAGGAPSALSCAWPKPPPIDRCPHAPSERDAAVRCPPGLRTCNGQRPAHLRHVAVDALAPLSGAAVGGLSQQVRRLL